MKTIRQNVEVNFNAASIKDVMLVSPVMNFLFGAVSKLQECDSDKVRISFPKGEMCVLHAEELKGAYDTLKKFGFMSQEDIMSIED